MSEDGMPTPKDLESAKDIPAVLAARYGDTMPLVDFTRLIYNHAIDDAANFLRDLAPQNPGQRLSLEAAEKSIRAWLTIPE